MAPLPLNEVIVNEETAGRFVLPDPFNQGEQVRVEAYNAAQRAAQPCKVCGHDRQAVVTFADPPQLDPYAYTHCRHCGNCEGN
ncbi:MAG: hypothetical protein V3S19_07170 [Gemmatimonadales bacterium]